MKEWNLNLVENYGLTYFKTFSKLKHCVFVSKILV